MDERTRLFPENRLGPSYVTSSGRYQNRQRQRQLRQFQCCICAGFLVVIVLALVITISYKIVQIDEDDANDGNSTAIEQAVFLDNKEIGMPYSDLNETNIIFLRQWPISDEPQKTFPTQYTLDDQTTSINEAIKLLGDLELFEENIISPEFNSPSYRHQRAVVTTLESRKLSKRGYVENCATLHLAKKLGVKKPQGIRWSIGEGPNIILQSNTVMESSIKCNVQTKYRNTDGSCNNRKHPLTWGVAMTPFRRAIHPDYSDGIMSPRRSKNNETLPSARTISTSVHRQSYSTDPNFTVMLAVFGQFLDHDITATALYQGQNGEPIECCGPEHGPPHPECYPVKIGPNDSNFEKYNITCMNFVRSAPAPTGHFGPRQQLNQASAYIDGSVVYGSTNKRMEMLRTHKNGKLRMFNTPDNRTLLPVSTDPADGCNEEVLNSQGKYCFESGDSRANENLHLTSMHLIWARHHNFISKQLQLINPHWTDEIIFQETRRIVAAQLQHITYNEFIPVILGEEFCKSVGLSPNSSLEASDTYDSTIDSSIANVFAACAFRFAHTLIPGLMNATKDNTTQESIELHRMLFNPYSLWDAEGLDLALASAINTLLEPSDPYFTNELTQKLFELNDAISLSSTKTATVTNHRKRNPGLDLVSLNIQRGRDHGLPSYSEWRRHCRLSTVDTWDDLKFAIDDDSWAKIRNLYIDASDVDLYTGALSEKPMKGAIVGPTLSCLITDQFLRLKRGDSFFYERQLGYQRFSKDQLAEIYKSTLSSIICRNSDHVTYSPMYVMRRTESSNPIKSCQDIDTFNFKPWRNSFVDISVSKQDANAFSIAKDTF